jgi:hypothetical protein
VFGVEGADQPAPGFTQAPALIFRYTTASFEPFRDSLVLSNPDATSFSAHFYRANLYVSRGYSVSFCSSQKFFNKTELNRPVQST